MPTYDYRCKECNQTFEVRQKMSDDPLKTCPQPDCEGEVKRLFGTGAGIIFKGSGFYQTDYRSDSYKKGAAADKPAPSCGKSECKTKGSCASSD